jgi:MoaA/NifB/PqqE/SkfB family radical SAM enzyme
MRSERVLTNLSCNQNCTFCTSRRATDERAFIHPAAVKQRIDERLASGAEELVLSGGEPLLRRDLESLVVHARKGGAQVVIETNATLIDRARALSLAAAGVTSVRVNVTGLASENDSVTRDEGGGERTLQGLEALISAGIAVELDAAIVRATLAGLPKLPGLLHARLGSLAAVRALVLRVPVEGAPVGELVSYEEAAQVIATVDSEARGFGLRLRLGPDSGPPPCVFPHQSRAAALFPLTPGAARRQHHVAVAACAKCLLADRCSGLPQAYLAQRPAPPMQPIEDEKIRRRLSIIGTVEEQVAREFVSMNRYESDAGPVFEKVVRVVFTCNQSCRFCFVSTHLPTPESATIRQAIVDGGRDGLRITLSGGEPTLHPELVAFVRLAKEHSTHPVCLQTNATRLTEAESVNALVEAGLGEAFVSLHGCTAETSDRVTGTPGTFEKTIRGIDQLAKAPITLVLNFVIEQRNQHELVPYVQFVASRWPTALVNFSFVSPATDVVPRETALIPRYSEAMPALAQAVADARTAGVKVLGFESMCGLPLCLVPSDFDRFLTLTEVPEELVRGEFVKPPPCRGCALEKKCYGVHRGYMALYGDAELRPVAAAS